MRSPRGLGPGRPRQALAAGAAILTIAAGAVSFRAGGSPQDGPDREIGALPPLPPFRRYPITSPFRVVVRDVELTTTEGVRIEAPRVAVEARLGEPGGPRLQVLSALVDRPIITVPASGRGDPGTGGPRGRAPAVSLLFTGIGPRITADTVRVRNARVRRRAAASDDAGSWEHDWRRVDVLATSVDLGGGQDGVDLRLSATGTVRGRPLTVGRLVASASRTADRLDARAEARLDKSRVRATALVRADGGVSVALDADTVLFDEVRALVRQLPKEGGATGRARVTWRDGETRIALENLRAGVGTSVATADGTLVLADPPRPVDLVVRSAGIDAADLRRFGVSLPRGRYAGVIRATGEGPGEVRVEVELERAVVAARGTAGSGRPGAGRAEVAAGSGSSPGPATAGGARGSPADRPFRVVARGIVGTASDPRVDLDMTGETAVGDSTVVVRARVSGPVDSLGVRADVPLALVAGPAGIPDARGVARTDLRIQRRDGPTVSGTVEFVDVTVPVDAARLEVTGGGTIRLEGGAAVLEDVVASVGGGRLRARGRLVPGEMAGVRIAGAEPGAPPGPVDLTIQADSVRAIDDPLGQIGASGRIRVTGTVDAPRVDGRITPSGWVREDYFAPPPGLDLDDPPLAALAARVPWPADSRLRRAAAGESGPTAVPPGSEDDGEGRDAKAGSPLDALTGRVVVEITPGLRMIDEDSEVRATGELVVELGDPVMTRGRVAVEDGFFAQYGTVFRVYGGAFVFDGPGLQPRIALRSTLEDEAPLVGDDEAPPAPEREPPIHQFGYGEVGSALELVDRYTVVSRSQLELVRYVLLAIEPRPVTGWRLPMVWRADAGTGLFDHRATAQAVPLAWSFIADQGYDYLPLDIGYLRAGVITVGGRYPTRIQLTAVMKAAAVMGGFELRLGQALAGEAPRLAAVYRNGGLRLEAFTGPRFYPAAVTGAGPGLTTRRRTGLAIRWGREY
jgi:hypothetical protein